MQKLILLFSLYGFTYASSSPPRAVEEVTPGSCWNCCKSLCTRQNINAALEDVRAVARATDVVVAVAAPEASPIVHLVTTAVDVGAHALEIPEPSAVAAVVAAAAPSRSSSAVRRSSVAVAATPQVSGELTIRTLRRTSVVNSSVVTGHVATSK